MYNKEHKYMQSKSIRLFDQQTDYLSNYANFAK